MVAHRLVLPLDMLLVHPMSHVLMLRKYISNPSHVLQPHSMEVNEDPTHEGELVAIVDYQLHQLRLKAFPMIKVLWRSNSVEEHT